MPCEYQITFYQSPLHFKSAREKFTCRSRIVSREMHYKNSKMFWFPLNLDNLYYPHQCREQKRISKSQRWLNIQFFVCILKIYIYGNFHSFLPHCNALIRNSYNAIVKRLLQKKMLSEFFSLENNFCACKTFNFISHICSNTSNTWGTSGVLCLGMQSPEKNKLIDFSWYPRMCAKSEPSFIAIYFVLSSPLMINCLHEKSEHGETFNSVKSSLYALSEGGKWNADVIAK